MNLIYIQLSSLIITFFIGLMLALSRLHITTIVRRYESSRWMIVCSMFIYALHYILQIAYGFRASGDDVGAVVNILFYAPVTFLLSFAIVNLSSGSRYFKRYIVYGIIGYVVILATFIIGLSVKHSLHLGGYLYVMGAEFFAGILVAVIAPFKENKRIRTELESNTAGDLGIYNKFMRTGTLLLLIVSLTAPAMILSRTLLFILGPLFLVILFMYAVNFVCLGFNLKPVADVLDSREKTSDSIENILSDEEIDTIKTYLDSWIVKGGYSNPDISLNKLASNIGCSSEDLSHFISKTKGVTFRVWLSKIRIEEAKRMLAEKPDATIEAIAEDCGFTSRSYFQNLFKGETGFTPREWRFKSIH